MSSLNILRVNMCITISAVSCKKTKQLCRLCDYIEDVKIILSTFSWGSLPYVSQGNWFPPTKCFVHIQWYCWSCYYNQWYCWSCYYMQWYCWSCYYCVEEHFENIYETCITENFWRLTDKMCRKTNVNLCVYTLFILISTPPS